MKRTPAWTTAAFLIGALISSASLLSVAFSSPEYAWLCWISLLPLFAVMRVLGPWKAMACGALWGLSFFTVSVSIVPGTVPATAQSFLLLTGISSLYLFLGATLTRRLGFNALLLGLGWVGVELCLRPLAPPHGLLAGTQRGCEFTHVVGGALGYAFVAFLIAFVNGLAVSAFEAVRVAILCSQPTFSIWTCPGRTAQQSSSSSSSSLLSSCQARGPPASCRVLTQS